MDVKRCQDCKHFRPGPGSMEPPEEFGLCAEPRAQWLFAATNRVGRFPFDILTGNCGRKGRWFEPKPEELAVPLPPLTGLTGRLNPQVPPKRSPVVPSRVIAAASVPRRLPVSAAAPAPSAFRSSTTDDGMSMLPAAMLLATHSEDGSAADAGSFGTSSSRWDAPVSGGGSFDGGGASGNWDSGSSSSSDSYSSSDSGSSSSSFD